MQAKDIMTPTVVTVGPEETVSAIANLLMSKKISAVPVLDKERQLCGIVSEGDLIRRISDDADDNRPWWLKMMSSNSEQAGDFIKAHGRTAKDVMTKNVATVDENMEICDVAHKLEANRIKRVPVMSGDQLVGIISRSNLLQVVAGQKTEIAKAATPGDRALRKQVHDHLNDQNFTSHGSLNVIIDDGVVELWGWVETETERDALILAAKEVPGVTEVRDHFGKVSPWVWGA